MAVLLASRFSPSWCLHIPRALPDLSGDLNFSSRPWPDPPPLQRSARDILVISRGPLLNRPSEVLPPQTGQKPHCHGASAILSQGTLLPYSTEL